MRTTLDLPDALFREVKTRAVQQGMKLKDLLAFYIEAGLRNPSIPAVGTPPGNRSPLPIAFKRVPGTPLVPARSNAELYAILEKEDIGEYRRVLEQSQRKS